MLKDHAGQLLALGMVLAVVVVLELHGNKDGGTIGELVAGAVGVAGAISGNRAQPTVPQSPQLPQLPQLPQQPPTPLNSEAPPA